MPPFGPGVCPVGDKHHPPLEEESKKKVALHSGERLIPIQVILGQCKGCSSCAHVFDGRRRLAMSKG